MYRATQLCYISLIEPTISHIFMFMFCCYVQQPSWKLADPISTFLFSLLVLITTLNILKETIHVLMEGMIDVMTLLCESQKCGFSMVNSNVLVNIIAILDYCLVTAHRMHVGQTTGRLPVTF